MEIADIEVEAEVTFFPTSVSGRISGITSGYRPNHNFFGPLSRNMCMGQVNFPDGEAVLPGQSRNVRIHFCVPQEYAGMLSAGFVWRLQEGGNHVGNGRVIALINS